MVPSILQPRGGSLLVGADHFAKKAIKNRPVRYGVMHGTQTEWESHESWLSVSTTAGGRYPRSVSRGELFTSSGPTELNGRGHDIPAHHPLDVGIFRVYFLLAFTAAG